MRLLNEVQQRLIEIQPVLRSTTDNVACGVLADTWNTLLELRENVVNAIVQHSDLKFAGGTDALKKALLVGVRQSKRGRTAAEWTARRPVPRRT